MLRAARGRSREEARGAQRKAEIEHAEIAEHRPRYAEHAEALDAEAVNKQRHAQHRDRKRQQGAEQVPPGVARDARPRPGPAIARHGSHAATSASRSISLRRRAWR